MSNRLDWITRYNKENNNEYDRFVFTNKYLAIQMPNHHKARSDGYVYIHQLQAEKKLGRLLRSEECVHHINYDKYDNDVNNLMIFKTNSDHIAFHAGDDIYLDGDVWVAIKYKSTICPMCNTNRKDSKSNTCLECNLKIRNSNMPSKDVLSSLIYKMSFEQIGRMYNVTGNAVKKWCKKYNLPHLRKDIKNNVNIAV